MNDPDRRDFLTLARRREKLNVLFLAGFVRKLAGMREAGWRAARPNA